MNTSKNDVRVYDTVNPVCDTTQNYCLSLRIRKSMPLQQATVQFADGSKYKYVSRYPVEAGDIAVIGNRYAKMFSSGYEMKTTGMIGVVTEVLPKVEIKRDYAAELDFVFSKSPNKKMVQKCAE